MMQEVAFVQAHTTSQWQWKPAHYAFNPKGKHHWLQRACLWILDRLSAYAFEEVFKTEMIRFKPQDVLHSITKQRCELLSLYRQEGARVLIGPDDFTELQADPRVRSMLSFEASYSNGVQVMGMQITVVPWMSGVLVVPKDFPASQRAR